MLKNLKLLLLLLMTSVVLHAQNSKKTALVKGRLINKATTEPANDIPVSFPDLKLLSSTDGEGSFTISQVPYGTQQIVVGGAGAKLDTITVVVNKEVVDLGDMMVTPNDASTTVAAQQNIPTIAVDESQISGSDDDGVKSQSVSGLLTASRDPFLNTASYVLGQYRFNPRGYESGSQQVLINGAPMNDVETGDAYWSQWGGLNDVIRSRNTTYGLQPSEYAFGGINGTVNFDATAADQRKQTRVSYSLTDRQYNNRLMLTHSTGLMKNGWAFSASFSKRWAKEGYVPGTFYDGYSYYAAASKRFNKKHTLNLTTFGAPTRRGKSAPTYKETTDLLDNNFYNPNWGYQNGEKRNAKVANNFQPVFLLNYEYTPTEKTRWNTTLGYQFGKNKNSTLDWYNAPDPRPDYYGYLPSYYINSSVPNPAAAEANRENFLNNPQINWNELYQANYLNRRAMPNPDGSLSSDSGRRSVYVLGNDVDDVKKFTFNTTLSHVLNTHITLYTGLSFISQRTESYRELSDLLGGDFYLDVNSFTERNFLGTTTLNQNNLNDPNKILHTGDKYFYDYVSHFNKGSWWGQAAFTYNKVDFFVSANVGSTSFSREGLFRNGLYADGNESYGKSDTKNFTTYGAKGGVTYKINGRNYLFLNGGLTADPPAFDNVFYSARFRNASVDVDTKKTYTAEGGYLLRSPKVTARVVGYVTDTKDGTDVQHFYIEGTGSANTNAAYILKNIATRSIGTELALEYKLSSAFTATGVAALGQSFYTNNPDVETHLENAVDVPVNEKSVYVKNSYLGVGPQSVYSLGLNYRSKKYWYATINGSYLDRNYVDIAPSKRTTDAAELASLSGVSPSTVFGQEKLPSAFTVDISGGKSFQLSRISRKIPRGTFLYLNVGVSNLLNNKDVVTGGFENLRYDYTSGVSNKFSSKYFYSYGRNFFVNLSLKF